MAIPLATLPVNDDPLIVSVPHDILEEIAPPIFAVLPTKLQFVMLIGPPDRYHICQGWSIEIAPPLAYKVPLRSTALLMKREFIIAKPPVEEAIIEIAPPRAM
jgi:hypothetical protein